VAAKTSSWLVRLPTGTDPATIDYGGPVSEMGSANAAGTDPVFS
jgi:hypothetical protein